MFVQFRVLLPALLATILLNAPARAETPVWSFNQINDSGHKAVVTATLDYGTPQSDAVQLRATCDGASHSSVVNLLIATDVNGLEDGEEVLVGFRAAGFSQSLKAHVTGIAAEQGITGVVLPVSIDEPLWNALTQQTSMSYGIAGLKPGKLLLHGGEEPVQNFCGRRIKLQRRSR